MARDNAIVVAKSNKESKLRRKKGFIEVGMENQKQKHMWGPETFCMQMSMVSDLNARVVRLIATITSSI